MKIIQGDEITAETSTPHRGDTRRQCFQNPETRSGLRRKRWF